MAASYRDSISANGSGTTITIDPSTLTYQADDVLVLLVWGYTSLGAPSGSDLTWTERLSDTEPVPFAGTGIGKAWTAIADASISSFTIAHGVADAFGWVLLSVQSGDTGSPVDASAINAANLNDTSGVITAPSVSPTGSDSLLICGTGYWTNDGASVTFTSATMTEREDFGSFNHYWAGTEALSASGATGTRTIVESPESEGGEEAFIAMSLAIKSSAGGGGGGRAWILTR